MFLSGYELVVKTGNVPELADKILEVYNNQEYFKERTMKTSKLLSEKYSWEAYSKRMETIFHKIIS